MPSARASIGSVARERGSPRRWSVYAEILFEI
jgi:hypothetical protein